METDIYLIRHAESAMNLRAEFICGRSNHTPLTEEGERQARMLGEYLTAEQLLPDYVMSSPAKRTSQTAKLSLGTMGSGKVIHMADEFQELCQGDWEGELRSNIYTSSMQQHINDMNGRFRPPGNGGESPLDVARRMRAAIEQVTAQHKGESIHIYTHGFAVRSLVAMLEGWSYKDLMQSNIGNTSITHLRHDGDWRVMAFAQQPQVIKNTI